jgi:hypothetical protein
MKKLTAQTQNVKPPTTIGFRLDTESVEVLASRAKLLRVSVHQLARYYVQLALAQENETLNVGEKIETLGEAFIEMRKDVAVATEALLTSAGKVSDQNAKTWVIKNLTKQ